MTPVMRPVGSRGILLCVIVAAAVCVAAIFVIIPLYMDYSVKLYCDEACNLYPGDAVQALIAYIESSEHSPQDKNHIVWTLGELRDPRALPVLRTLLQDQAGDEPGLISRYEVEKAIKKITGEKRSPYFWK